MKKQAIKTLLQQHEDLVEQLVAIAEDPRSSAETLRNLSKVTDNWIIASVSTNPATPSDVLEWQLRMADGSDAEMRIHIAGNPALRLEVLRRLVKVDPSSEVRGAALLVLSKRISARSDVTASQLWGLYGSLAKLGKKAANRASHIKEVLFRHPKFPYGKLDLMSRKRRK